MSFSYDDKLCLSQRGMKIVAAALATGTPAKEAVRAGMRASCPSSVNVSGSDGAEISVTQPVIWVSGTTGSGKSELAHACVRTASAFGRPTLMVSDETFAQRWDSGDAVRLEDDTCTIDSMRTAFAAGKHVSVRAPRPYDVPPAAYEARLSSLLSIVRESVPEDGLVVLDEVNWLRIPDRSLLISMERGQVMCLTQNDRSITHLRTDADALIGLFSTDPSDGPERTKLSAGRGILFSAHGQPDVRFSHHQIAELAERTRAHLTRAVERVVQRLEGRTWDTHTQRLEAVARACGYRSWHAAQGRCT